MLGLFIEVAEKSPIDVYQKNFVKNVWCSMPYGCQVLDRPSPVKNFPNSDSRFIMKHSAVG